MEASKANPDVGGIKPHSHNIGDFGQLLLDTMSEYYETHQFSDVTLIVGRERGKKQTLKSHALLLAAASPVLCAKICKSRQISLDDDPNLFKILLQYVYTGNMSCLGKQISELKSLFVKYQIVRTDDLFVFGPDCCCLLYTSPSPRDRQKSRMPSSA